MYGKGILKRLGFRVKSKVRRRRKAASPEGLTPIQRNVLKQVYDGSTGVGSGYAKVSNANMIALGDLGRRGLVQTGDKDDFTVNAWLTPMGEMLAAREFA